MSAYPPSSALTAPCAFLLSTYTMITVYFYESLFIPPLDGKLHDGRGYMYCISTSTMCQAIEWYEKIIVK